MKNAVFGMCLAAAMTAALAAQDKMTESGSMGMAKTYSGCVEKSASGELTLTHAMASGMMPHDGMKHDGMKDEMKTDEMKKDGMAKDAMAPDSMGESLALTSKTVKLAKYVGQKVAVTGTADHMPGMESFAVASVKTIAKSCK